MELQHFSHKHPLVLTEERSYESEKAYCSGCGELVSGPSFECAECGFYLDKMCADAPSKLNHPFHRKHSLKLLVSKPYKACVCDFCDKGCDKFVYHCSCKLDFHIKCALLSKKIAEKSIGELEDSSDKDTLISIENRSQELKETVCFACWKPLLDFPCLYLDSGFCLHKKCVDLPTKTSHSLHGQHPLTLQFNSKHLPCQICRRIKPRGFVYYCPPCEIALHIACADLPTKINHLCHRKHPLILQFNPESLPCQICHEIQDQGPVYCCSTCKFSLHDKCMSPAPTIKGELHEHPFTLFWRQIPFVCDACGTAGDYVSYICSACSLIVHEKCISLLPIIRLGRHHHQLSHTFIPGQQEMKTWKCRICPEQVNAQHGGYCCSACDYIVHANCGKEDSSWYIFGELEKTDELLGEILSFLVVKQTKSGEDVIATEIKHVSHQHNLVLSNDAKDDKRCDGCVLFISSSFYYCLECDFFLHKSCAESPGKKYLWLHKHQRPLTLIFVQIFECSVCRYEFNIGLAYECAVCSFRYCLGCALISDTPTCKGHEHSLTCYRKYEGQCSGCGAELISAFACKDCNFAVDYPCLRLPNKTRHKCDEHPLILTYHEDNVYLEYNYCDICEEIRNPNHCFYQCITCDTSAHPKCAMGTHPFLKPGRTYTHEDHPHPLIFTRKVSDYTICHKCDQPCLDLALECQEYGCNYSAHWECIKNFW